MNYQEIIQETERTLTQTLIAEQRLYEHAEHQGINPLHMMYSDGSLAIMPVLIAKAHLLSVLYDAEDVINLLNIFKDK